MRRVFDEKFKTKSVSMIDEGYSVTEICSEQKITPKQLRNWEFERRANKLESAEKTIAKLEKKIAGLEQELQTLRKQTSR